MDYKGCIVFRMEFSLLKVDLMYFRFILNRACIEWPSGGDLSTRHRFSVYVVMVVIVL